MRRPAARLSPSNTILLALMLCAMALPAMAQSTYTRTKYPIVLVHGLLASTGSSAATTTGS